MTHGMKERSFRGEKKKDRRVANLLVKRGIQGKER